MHSKSGTINQIQTPKGKITFAAQAYSPTGKQRRKRFSDELEAIKWLEAIRTGTTFKPLNPHKVNQKKVTLKISSDKISCAGGYWQAMPNGKIYAQIYAGYKQHRRKFGNAEEAKNWLHAIAGGEQPLTSWQIAEAKRAYAMIAESGNGKSLLECLQIGLNATSPTATTLSKAIDEYLKSIRDSISVFALKDYSLYLFRLQKKLGEKTNLLTLNRASINDFLQNYHNKPHSYNHAIRSISAFCTWARKCEYLTSNPIFGIAKMQILPDDIKFLSVDDSRNLLISAAKNKPGMVPYIAVSMFAGLRPYECMRLTSDDINMETGYIRLGVAKTKSKKGSGRMIPINATLSEWLDMYPVTHQVISLKPRAVVQNMHLLANAAGVKLSHDVLRHTYATYAHASDHTPDATAQAMGHSVAIAKAHYVGLVTAQQGKAFFAITPSNIMLGKVEDYKEPQVIKQNKAQKIELDAESKAEMRTAFAGFLEME